MLCSPVVCGFPGICVDLRHSNCADSFPRVQLAEAMQNIPALVKMIQLTFPLPPKGGSDPDAPLVAFMWTSGGWWRGRRTSNHPNRPGSHTMAATWLVAVMANLANKDGSCSSSSNSSGPSATISPYFSVCATVFVNFSSSVRWIFSCTCVAFWSALLFLAAFLVLAVFCCSLFCALLVAIAPF